jgi:formate dehydrogenase
VGARIIGGLVPCNVIPEEILSDNPARYRAMLVESGNPLHSLADTPRMREALRALELLVVIDIALTETAREAHYVLPATSQFEKWEATFFNFDFPRNVFHLRAPVVSAPDGPLPEPEIHARLVEALGAYTEDDLAPLQVAARESREAFATAFFEATAANPRLVPVAPVVLYRTLGPTLPDGAASAALLWGAAHRCAMANEAAVRRAGFTGDGLTLGESLFQAILDGRHGVEFTSDGWDDVWGRVHTDDGRLHVHIPELLEELRGLGDEAAIPSVDYPLVLSAGERRSFTANTIMRDPSWRKRDAQGALRVSSADAEAAGVSDGGVALLTTPRGSARVTVEVSPMMQPGHVSLPNGMGLDAGDGSRAGVAPNELTSGAHRDPIAGTPWHKSVPARLEPVP